MPEEKKASAKKEVSLVTCKVLETGTKYGSITLAENAEINIPSDKAKSLEGIKKVKILGIPA